MNRRNLGLLHKFLKNNCTEEEVQQVVAWINSEESKAEVLEALHDYATQEANEIVDSERMYSEIIQSIQQYQRETETFDISSKVVTRGAWQSSGRYLAIAASISLLVISSWFINNQSKSSQANDQMTEIIKTSKETEFGQKLKVTLPDGTMVKLNSNSAIEYEREGFKLNRKVLLKGEAFFDVKRNEQFPFIISTEDGFDVRVLGTSFSVNTEQVRSEIKVAVKSGEVQVTSKLNGDAILLGKGEMVKSIDEKFIKEEFSNEMHLFAWVDNRLVFNNTAFDKVKLDVELWFGVKISSEVDHSEFDSFTASFENPTIVEVMETFSHAYNFKYEIEDELIRIINK